MDWDQFREKPQKSQEKSQQEHDSSRLILQNPYKEASLRPMKKVEKDDFDEQFDEMQEDFFGVTAERSVDFWTKKLAKLGIKDVKPEKLTAQDKIMWEKVENRLQIPVDKNEFTSYYQSVELAKDDDLSRYNFASYMFNLIK
jgi:hypothetical protein